MLIPIEYLLTPYAITVNGIMLIAAISSATYRLKINIPLCSEKYQTQGIITHSEYGMFASNINLRPEAIVSCRYEVNSKVYNVNVGRWGFSERAIATSNPKGKNVTVYYSPIKPEINSVDTLPRKIDVISRTIFSHAFFYLALVLIAYSAYKDIYL